MHEVRAGLELEQLHREMMHAARARGAVRQAFGPALRERDQLLHVLGGHLRADGDVDHGIGKLDHGDEVALRVVGKIGAQAGVDPVVRRVRHEERHAVGRRLLHELRGDDAARSGAVVDHGGNPQSL
jgi:hypothetical protein